MHNKFPSKLKLHQKDANFIQRHPVIPPTSIYTLLKMMSKKNSQEQAIDCLESNLTYDEMFTEVDMIAETFLKWKVKSGDIITIVMPNYYQGIVCFLAANKLGACVTFLNSFASIEEIKMYLSEYESRILVKGECNEAESEIFLNETKVERIIQIASDCEYPEIFKYSELIKGKRKKQRYSIWCGENPAIILYTSGTTGKPKSVVLTNENVIATAIYLKNSSNISNVVGERSLVCVPFCYPYGFVTSVLMSLLCGRTVILGPNLSGSNIENYYKRKPNIVFGSPALLELTIKNISRNTDLSSVKVFISGGDFLRETLAHKAISFFEQHKNNDLHIINGSGNAETCGGNTNAYGQEVPFLSVGKPLYGINAIVVDEELKELPYGQEGMLCISGKNVFREYFRQPELTKKATFQYKGKRYFKTETRGKLLTDGTFELTGRASRFYIISTLNKVYCDHVQMALDAIEIVQQSAVVKQRDEDNLYVGHAFIVLNKNVDVTQELDQYIRQILLTELLLPSGECIQLKEYEVPKYITYVSELPRTKADKIDYMKLEKLCEEEK